MQQLLEECCWQNQYDVENRYRKYIISESTLSPIDIENQTSSFGGSLYGNSSNNKFAAFYDMLIFRQVLKICFLKRASRRYSAMPFSAK
jgi:hypothetical protein